MKYITQSLQSGIQVGWGSQWDILATAISDYYGQGVGGQQYEAVVDMLNSGEYTMQEMEGILQQIPNFDRTYNANGELVRVSYNASVNSSTAAGSAASAVNSNVATSTKTQFSTVQNITKDAQTGKVAISDTVKKYNSGVATDAKAVAGSAVAAVGAAAVGISLAKTIDSTLYNANPDFWDERGMQGLNPETWSSITAGDNSLGATLFNWVFQIDDTTGNPTAYLDENTFAYMAAYMASMGVFDYTEGATLDDPSPLWHSSYDYVMPVPFMEVYEGQYVGPASWGDRYIRTVTSDDSVYAYKFGDNNIRFLSTSPFAIEMDGASLVTSHALTHDGITYYISDIGVVTTTYPKYTDPQAGDVVEGYAWDICYIINNGTITQTGAVDGITPQEGQTQFDVSGISDVSDIPEVLTALQTQFPELWNNRIEISPDGETIKKYIPVGFPTGGTGTEPTTIGATKTDLAPDISGEGQNATEELIKTLIDMIQNPKQQNGMESDTTTPTLPVDPNDNGMGVGTTPAIVLPTGSTSALYSIYNPSQGELNSFGAWLWSPNFVDQLLKVFNDPMQAIIGLHKIFATPSTSGRGNIKVGYLDSGVATNLVSAQYTEVDCGTVNMPEYFENALDYTETEIYLYLPFIGIVPISALDVLRGSINVKYKVDVLTGACLAQVNVFRDSMMGGQLYTYAGNCAVQYPLSSGSYMGILTGILGVAGTVASTIASGGAMLPMALGIGASALGGAKTKVEHSGSLSGNAGAMGIKSPYLIIRRPQTLIANGFRSFDGESNNKYVTLSSCSGFTRVKSLHLENIPATDTELSEIETYLKSGVFV